MESHARQWRRLAWVGAAALSVAALVAGCSNSGADPDGGPSASGTPVYGGNINIQISGDPQSLDLVTANTPANGAPAALIYDHLFEADANHIAQKNLVEDETVSSDGLTYTFALRPEVTWWDGTPLTADDVVASLTRWERLSGAGKTASATIVSIAAKDANTVVVQLNQRRYGFENELAAPGTEIYNAKILANYMDKNLPNHDPSVILGTGPYQLSSWDSQKMVLSRYEGYKSLDSEPSGAAGAKRAYLDTVTFIYAGDSNAIVNGLTTGQFDVAAPSVDQYDTVSSDPDLDIEWNAGATINTLCPNMAPTSKFASIEARQALNYLVDKNAMASAFGLDEGMSYLDSAFVPEDRTDLHSTEGSDTYAQYDPDKAKELFTQAGITAGTHIKIMDTSTFPQVHQWAQILQDELSKIGLVGDITTLDYSSMLAALQQQPDAWDVTIVTFNGQVPDLATMNMLNRPWGNFQTDELKADIAAYSNSSTPEEAKAAVDKTQGYIWSNLSQIVMLHSKSFTVFSAKVHGYKFGLTAANLWVES